MRIQPVPHPNPDRSAWWRLYAIQPDGRKLLGDVRGRKLLARCKALQGLERRKS